MVQIVLIIVLVQHVIDLLVFVIVMELNVIEVNFYFFSYLILKLSKLKDKIYSFFNWFSFQKRKKKRFLLNLFLGPITRSQLESQCLPSSKSSNLALIIVLPIVGVTLLSIATGFIVYHQLIKKNPRKFLFKKRREEFSPQSSIF